MELENFEQKWGLNIHMRYAHGEIIGEELTVFFDFPVEIRKIIYNESH